METLPFGTIRAWNSSSNAFNQPTPSSRRGRNSTNYFGRKLQGENGFSVQLAMTLGFYKDVDLTRLFLFSSTQ
jgi:hypothetical protein